MKTKLKKIDQYGPKLPLKNIKGYLHKVVLDVELIFISRYLIFVFL